MSPKPAKQRPEPDQTDGTSTAPAVDSLGRRDTTGAGATTATGRGGKDRPADKGAGRKDPGGTTLPSGGAGQADEADGRKGVERDSQTKEEGQPAPKRKRKAKRAAAPSSDPRPRPGAAEAEGPSGREQLQKAARSAGSADAAQVRDEGAGVHEAAQCQGRTLGPGQPGLAIRPGRWAVTWADPPTLVPGDGEVLPAECQPGGGRANTAADAAPAGVYAERATQLLAAPPVAVRLDLPLDPPAVIAELCWHRQVVASLLGMLVEVGNPIEEREQGATKGPCGASALHAAGGVTRRPEDPSSDRVDGAGGPEDNSA